MIRRLGDERGAVAVLTATLAVVLLMIAALVVDLGLARDSRRQAQNTADAAALAAANALYATRPANLNRPGDFAAAVSAAKDYAAENYGTTEAEWASCSTTQALAYVHPGTGTNCISFDAFLYPREALVVVPVRNQPVFFGGLVGYEGVGISALAQARVDPGGRNMCTFCVVGDGTHNLQNGNLSVAGGNMWFNGDVEIMPNGSATSTPGYVVGEDGTQTLDGGNAYVENAIKGSSTKFQGGAGQAGQPRIVDPLAADVLPFATQATLTSKPAGTSPCGTSGPGIYSGFKYTSSSPCVLQPGLYVFTGDFELSGNAGQLVANGVTFYFTCGSGTSPAPCSSPGQTGGGIKITGNGGYLLEAPLKSTYPTLPEELYGYSIVYDRYNTADMTLRGNGSSTVSGTIYGVNATLDFRGNGGTDVPLSSMIVVGDVTFSGNNASLNVVFDSTKNRRPSEGARGLVK